MHAAFSFGALTGAGLAALAAAADVSPLPHLSVAAVIGAAIALALTPGLLRDEGDRNAPCPSEPPPRRPWVIAFCALLAEGAVFDWSSVYLASGTGASESVAAFGLAAFALSHGRWAATRGSDLGASRCISVHLGATLTTRTGSVLAGLGLGLA